MSRRAVFRALAAIAAVLVALIGTTAVMGAFYEPNTTIPQGFAGQHLDVLGVPVRVFQQGTGPDVVLIHGSPGSIEDWSPVLSALSGSARLTVFDRPGHGFSGDTGSYSLNYNAHIALALIDRLGLQHVVLVGHSFGGATALAAALQKPDSVDALVTIDSATYTPPRRPDPVYSLLTLPNVGVGFARLLGSALAPKKIRAGLIETFHGHPPSDAFLDLRTRIWAAPKVAHAIASEYLGYGAWLTEQSPHYAQIKRPVFILGQNDDAFRRATAEHLHRDIAGSSLRLVSNAGHYLQFEKTADVVAAIRAAIAARAVQ